MDNLELRRGLIDDTFSTGNDYSTPSSQDRIVFLHYMQEIPVITYNNAEIGNTDPDKYTIFYGNTYSFRGRKCTKQKLIEILCHSRSLQKVKYGSKTYYAAQGFFAEEDDPFENIIFLHSVNKHIKREDVNPYDINLYINKKYIHNTDFKKEEVIIKEMMQICEGNITYCTDPLKKFEKRLIFKSKTVQGLKRELNFYVKSIFRDLRSEAIKTLWDPQCTEVMLYNPVFAEAQADNVPDSETSETPVLVADEHGNELSSELELELAEVF